MKPVQTVSVPTDKKKSLNPVQVKQALNAFVQAPMQ